MRSIDLFKASFKQPNILLQARYKKKGPVFLYMILLSFLLSLPVMYQAIRMTQTILDDSTEIISNLPPFKIEDGVLTTETKDAGLIYQTNSIIFTFDPDNKRNIEDIKQDAVSQVIAVALLKNEALLVLPNMTPGSELLANNTLNLPYSLLESPLINSSEINSINAGSNSRIIWFSILLSIAMIIVFLNLVFYFSLIALFALSITRFRGVALKYGEVFKIIVYASTAPILLTMCLQFIIPNISFSTVGVFGTLLIYFKTLPKKIKNTK